MSSDFGFTECRSVTVDRLTLREFRNLREATLEFSPGLNILTGNNGQGKTSFLEALVVGMTSRSFRTDQSKEVIAYGKEAAMTSLRITESDLLREQRVVLTRQRKNTLIDEKRIAKVADFACRTPVVVFHPADLELVSGPAALRRTLLDRIAFYLSPFSLEAQRAYVQALRERQRLLQERGVHAAGLDAYEQVASEYGTVLARCHATAAQKLIEAISPVVASLAPEGIPFLVNYLAAGTEDAEQFRITLRENRSVDMTRGRASFGPQRDDLKLLIADAEARKHASQGQQRLFALALKLAELASVREARGQHPVLLLDDVASELDPHRTQAVLEWVSRIRSQVFVTTTRWTDGNEQLFPNLPRRRFWVHDGVAEQES
jgi:DNA replication and repair protein RecF